MTDCKSCGATGLEWHTNLGRLVNPITGQYHGKDYCAPKEPKEIPLYLKDFNGTLWPRPSDRVLHELVDDAMRLGADPWNFQTVIRGDKIQVKR